MRKSPSKGFSPNLPRQSRARPPNYGGAYAAPENSGAPTHPGNRPPAGRIHRLAPLAAVIPDQDGGWGAKPPLPPVLDPFSADGDVLPSNSFARRETVEDSHRG